MDFFNNFDMNSVTFHPDPILTEAEIKELQREIFDQNLSSALKDANEKLNIPDEQNVCYVRGENRTYFMTEEDEEECQPNIEIKSSRNDHVEFEENKSISESVQELPDKLNNLETDNLNYIAQAGDEGKLFTCESFFDSEKDLIREKWMGVNSAFEKLSTNSPPTECPIYVENKPVDTICIKDVNSRAVLEEILDPRKHDHATEKFRISEIEFEKDRENMSKYDKPKNENFQNMQEVRELEEKDNCKEESKESKVERLSTKVEIYKSSFKILNNEIKLPPCQPKVDVDKITSNPKTEKEISIRKLETEVESISVISEAEKTLIKLVTGFKRKLCSSKKYIKNNQIKK